LKWLVCVRASDGHAWIYAKNLDNGEEHTYGRWRKGYGGNRDSGVKTDCEMKWKKKYDDYSERCVEVDSFTPTINKGFGIDKPGQQYVPGWHDRYNNCTSYACDEWKRISGEGLYPGLLYHDPGTLRQSIDQRNQFGGSGYYPPGGKLN
jgi:hypothetical protein